MGDVSFAVARRQGHGDAPNPDLGVAAAGRREDIVQRAFGIRIVGGELPALRAQQRAIGQHGVAARIGVDDASARIDDEHAGSNSIQSIREARRLHCPEIDYLADECRAANVRNDQSHAPTHLAVDDTVALTANDGKNHRGGDRLFEIRERAIQKPCGRNHSL